MTLIKELVNSVVTENASDESDAEQIEYYASNLEQLIGTLQKIKNKHGNLPVAQFGRDGKQVNTEYCEINIERVYAYSETRKYVTFGYKAM